MIAFFKSLFQGGKNVKKDLQLTVMLIGLDNAGKTTLLSSIQGGKIIIVAIIDTKNQETKTNVTPTIGFNREQIKHGRYDITYFDLGGNEKFRGIWTRYFAAVPLLFIICH
jgi:ADP-ribosylation factor-like protein 13B